MTYRYRVLGATQVLRPDGSEVPISGSRLRAVLTALVAAGGRPVRAGELVDELWGEEKEPPADTTAALQALIGRLRRALGRETVTSVPGGYRLAADPGDIDLTRFDRLTARGTKALDDGDADRAARILDEALALWHGPALADLPRRDGDPVAVRAERRRTEALRGRLAADIARGRAEAALPDLTELAAAQPLDEPLQALRIRALRASGRPAEALQAYEDVRGALADRLGTDPGPELRSLHAELLNPPDRTTGRGPVGVAAAEGMLRPRLTSFVGREGELRSLGAELPTRRLITLVGTGGVGKTRLALEAADAARALVDGVRVAELASVRNPVSVTEAVLTALGGHETRLRGPAAGAADPSREPLERLVDLCGTRRMLLVLDNCEHVVEAAARLVETLLTRCPGVRVLATSREPLGVPGETVRTVGPLPLDGALRLLAERGAAARAGFRTDDDPEACAEICRRLDGLPLAVELAAARLRALSPRQIAERLDDRFRLLGTGGRTSRTALPRQQTLRAVVDWSWDLLDPAERTALRRLAVFAGGCAPEQAEEVCGAAEVLASLVDKSLVVARPGAADGRMRYRLLDTVAEYAARRLDDAGEREAVEHGHLVAYRELVRIGDPRLRGAGQPQWLERFETEHDNVRAALRTAVARRDEQEALCLTLAMSWFWQLRGHQADARHWASVAAGLGPDPFADPVRRAVPLAGRCTDVPPPWDEERLWEARRGVRLLSLAGGDPAATTHLDGIVAAYRPGLPQNCRQPGSMWYFARLMAGESGGLGESVGALVDACRGHGEDGWDLGLALLMRAKLADEGPEEASEALAAFERAGDPWGIAESLSARGEVYERRGAYEEAVADYARAMEAAALIGARSEVPVFKARLASVRLEAGGDRAAHAAAEEQLRDAVEESRALAGQSAGTTRLLLARHYGRTGRTGEAREQLHLVTEVFPTGAPALFAGTVAGLHAWLDCLDGAYVTARDHVREAVRELADVAYLVAPELITDQLLVAARAAAHLGHAHDGAVLLAAYDTHRSAEPGGFSGFRPFPPAAADELREGAERDLRTVLDPAQYSQAYQEGAPLTVEEAAALV
ncbi:BTAD domain-containing putative transcriptional regulator [Streptomyces sp. NPDC059881]|uniref:BTAD domain-containing putative transcriptional regulator n=1 Tax=Streptomyces sp. NPDC059881 TaxID=3346986 RepID=UPI003653B4EE